MNNIRYIFQSTQNGKFSAAKCLNEFLEAQLITGTLTGLAVDFDSLDVYQYDANIDEWVKQ